MNEYEYEIDRQSNFLLYIISIEVGISVIQFLLLYTELREMFNVMTMRIVVFHLNEGLYLIIIICRENAHHHNQLFEFYNRNFRMVRIQMFEFRSSI